MNYFRKLDPEQANIHAQSKGATIIDESIATNEKQLQHSISIEELNNVLSIIKKEQSIESDDEAYTSLFISFYFSIIDMLNRNDINEYYIDSYIMDIDKDGENVLVTLIYKTNFPWIKKSWIN